MRAIAAEAQHERYLARKQVTDDPLRQCQIDSCSVVIAAKGLCMRHYYRQRAAQPASPQARQCPKNRCKLPIWALGYCRNHYKTGKSEKLKAGSR